MVTFIDDHREQYGVEPICRVLPIAPSTYRAYKARQRNPDLRCNRAKRDELIEKVWKDNRCVYVVRKLWRAVQRLTDEPFARCTVARLMRSRGIQGVVHGRRVKTTIAVEVEERPGDLVNRQFEATRPN